MRRVIAATIVVAALAAAPASGSAIPHVASCGNSFPADGHSGPWRTSNNGGTLHGNTVHISCPNSSTHWDIVYHVQIVNPANGDTFDKITDHRMGNGAPPDFSEAISPYPCDTAFVYRTHVDNRVTGGNINKPSGGGGVHLNCN